jgi:hypothetical protein
MMTAARARYAGYRFPAGIISHRRARRDGVDLLVHRQARRRVDGMHPEDAAQFCAKLGAMLNADATSAAAVNARRPRYIPRLLPMQSAARFFGLLRNACDDSLSPITLVGVSICNRNRIMTGLRFLFRVTLRRLDLAAEIYRIREPQKIPLVMSPDETPAGGITECSWSSAVCCRIQLGIIRSGLSSIATISIFAHWPLALRAEVTT